MKLEMWKLKCLEIFFGGLDPSIRLDLLIGYFLLLIHSLLGDDVHNDDDDGHDDDVHDDDDGDAHDDDVHDDDVHDASHHLMIIMI
jgi:hypothetical protein